MKKQLFPLFILSLLMFSCPNENKLPPDSTDPTTVDTPTEVPIPTDIPPFEIELAEEYKVLKEASGDLNKDGIAEKVVVVNNGQMGDMGEERDILIFMLEDKEWNLWDRSSGAVMPSEHGGMFGDPFRSIKVENETIVIKHSGGSRTQWEYLHRFRYQNDNCELIGVTIINEEPCRVRETFDYNLSTGKVICTKVNQKCTNGENPQTVSTIFDESFKYKMKSLPVMDGFDQASIYAVNPDSGVCFPESNCYEYNENNKAK
jgi:hypothetical protein